MSSNVKASFSAANVFPAKILCNLDLIKSCIEQHHIYPVHIQLNPTNRCMFSCPFCSCGEREKTLQMSFGELEHLMLQAADLGCSSVTITGGGEPLSYPHWEDLLALLYDLDIDAGLVTNGLLLDRLQSNESLVWCRISSSDHLATELGKLGKSLDDWFGVIDKTCSRNGHVDWAFSHVLSGRSNPTFMRDLIVFATEHKFTHTRLVSDIFDPLKSKMSFDMLKQYFEEEKIDLSHVILQDRAHWTHGQNPCYISLLKPVIGADGYVYPCCGTQYALANPSRDYEKTMRMGLAADLSSLIKEQKFFDGSVCVKCFYSQYNWALGTLLSNIKHKAFV